MTAINKIGRFDPLKITSDVVTVRAIIIFRKKYDGRPLFLSSKKAKVIKNGEKIAFLMLNSSTNPAYPKISTIYVVYTQSSNP